MNNLYLKNIYFCVILPALVSGITTIGVYFFGFQMSLGYCHLTIILLLSGSVGYLVGTLIRSNYKWRKR